MFHFFKRNRKTATKTTAPKFPYTNTNGDRYRIVKNCDGSVSTIYEDGSTYTTKANGTATITTQPTKRNHCDETVYGKAQLGYRGEHAYLCR